MTNFSVSFKNKDYEDFINGSKTLLKFLETTLLNESYHQEEDSTAQIIRNMLLRYYLDEGGSPTVDEFIITDCKYDERKKSGRVCFEFSVNYWFGCSDIDSTEDGHEIVNFTLDIENSKISLHFPKPVIRTTDGEY